VAAIFACGWWGWRALGERRHPQRADAVRLLEQRLGRMTPEQARLARTAIDRDPLSALLAAESGGWERLQHLVATGPDVFARIQRHALDGALRGELDGPTAARFADNAYAQWVLVEQLGADAGAALVEQLTAMSPDECRNVAYDPSYALIAPRLSAPHRETLRQHQEVLTPMLAGADPNQWSGLVDRYQRALPRVGEIARDETLGTLYAQVYMLHSDRVEALKAVGIPEREALDFVGLNAASLRELEALAPPDAVAEQVKRLRNEFGPDGKRSLFAWACWDPAVFWLAVHAQRTAEAQRSAGLAAALTILRRYAGEAVPMILSQYAEDDAGFRGAMSALVRFDNFGPGDQESHCVAAKTLSHFQHDDVFKAALARHGARLVPAVTVSEDALAQIAANPNNIDKFVTPDGQPIAGKPWWTWVPGGSIVYVARELGTGRTTEAGDWVWAGVDVLVFLPISRAAMPIRWAGKAAPEGASLLARSSAAVGREVAATMGQAVWRESLLLLRQGGIALGRGALYLGRKAAEIGWRYPLRTTLLSIAVLAAVFPEGTADLLDRIPEWFAQRLTKLAQTSGRAMMELPGTAINAVWEKARELGQEQPMLAWLFYLLAATLVALIVVCPVALLKWLLPDVFALLQHALVAVLCGAATAAGAAARRLRRPATANRKAP
jgi:hypothetical protein